MQYRYDVDESGTIDGDELEDVLYDCGVILSDENIEAARRGLGIQKASDSCDLATFKTWFVFLVFSILNRISYLHH